MKRPWQSIQVACAYVGTVVGAGFASGRELHQFFGRHGLLFYPACCLSIVLFAWVGYRVMMLGHQYRATSYTDVSQRLFGRIFGRAVNASINVMMFGITVAMLAGAGALFHERLDVSFSYGAIFTAILTFVTLLYGLGGLLRLNTLIVPTMFGFLCVVCYRVIETVPAGGAQPWWSSFSHLSAASGGQAVLSALVYVALNVGLAVGVLIPIGGAIEDQDTLRFGALLGAIALGVMMMTVLAALERIPDAMDTNIPMAFIASRFGTLFSRCFMVVLFGEIFSTLVGNVFTLVTQIPARYHKHRHWIIIGLLIAAFGLSHIGFSSIVAYGYTFFGWLSSAFLVALLWPRRRLSK